MEWVLEVAEYIKARGLQPWLDVWYVRPGTVFQYEIETVLRQAKTIVVFVGPNGFGKWELLEMRVAVSLFVEQERPVIPVILPGAESQRLPLFLREFHRIEFKSTTDTVALENLEWAVTGRHPRR